MSLYYDHSGIQIHLGDCRDILPTLPKVDLVLTDPPYGINYALPADRVHWKHNTFYNWLASPKNGSKWSVRCDCVRIVYKSQINVCRRSDGGRRI